jgi:hypothetical protein
MANLNPKCLNSWSIDERIDRSAAVTKYIITGLLLLTAFGRVSVEPGQGGVLFEDKPAGLVVRKVAVAEYRTGYLYSDGNFYAYFGGHFIQLRCGGRKIIDVTTGFNLLLALDDQGFVWTSRLRDAVMTRLATDTTGAPFDHNESIYGYANTHVGIRSDGSLWYWGDDSLHFFHRTGAVNIRPLRMSPAGMKIQKAVMSINRILVLTKEGQVWEWLRNKGLQPRRIMVPRPAVDIFTSQWDYAGCIVPDYDSPKGMGYPYVWGTDFGFWGGSAPALTPIPVKVLWKMTAPVKEIDANYNTTHYIDAEGRLFGIGDNVMGEVGNGEELVNQYQYKAPYNWTFMKNEFLRSAPPVEIGKGVRWKKLFSNNFLAFYKYALDENDSLYFWGRDKALVSGRGWQNMQDGPFPNAMDVLTPTIVHPISAPYQTYVFHLPVISAGSDQAIRGSFTTLKGWARGPYLVKDTRIAANDIDTIDYPVLQYEWTKMSGPSCKIVSPKSAETQLTGLTPGLYLFRLKSLDSNNGTQSSTVSIKVSR